MAIRILGVRLDDEDGNIMIDWMDESEQSREGGVAYQTYITLEGQQSYGRVGYYAKELREDIDELLGWWRKYRSGYVD